MILNKLRWLRKSPAHGTRNVIVHYHLFKNAGSSIDHILKENFGERRWRSEEFSGPTTNIPLVLSGQSNYREVEEWLAAHPEVIALSSHTAAMPLPELPRTQVWPIVMVREPVIRLQSSYLFQRARFQSGFDDHTTRLAGENDLAGYLRGLLSMERQSMARNFASVRLAGAVPGSPEQLRQRAFEALRVLPFVGVVERFDLSMQVLQEWLAPHFPKFRVLPVWQNPTDKASTPTAERLNGIRQVVGDDLYRQVVAANRIDIDLHQAAIGKITKAVESLTHRAEPDAC